VRYAHVFRRQQLRRFRRQQCVKRRSGGGGGGEAAVLVRRDGPPRGAPRRGARLARFGVQRARAHTRVCSRARPQALREAQEALQDAVQAGGGGGGAEVAEAAESPDLAGVFEPCVVWDGRREGFSFRNGAHGVRGTGGSEALELIQCRRAPRILCSTLRIGLLPDCRSRSPRD
jgi:hypothetical protein